MEERQQYGDSESDYMNEHQPPQGIRHAKRFLLEVDSEDEGDVRYNKILDDFMDSDEDDRN